MLIAGIVLFNPEINRLKENILNISKQVDRIILIDNNSTNINNIVILINHLQINSKTELIYNKENYGIAYALNQILYYAESHGYCWVLTMDQDSVLQNNIIELYEKFTKLSGVSMISCVLKDRNIKEFTESTPEPYIEVDRCITSGCYTNVKMCLSVGGFDNNMFIDYVDYEMCLRLKKYNYKIIRVNQFGLLHEVGNNSRRLKIGKHSLKVFGNPIEIHNESPVRTYYFFRNLVYILRKHKRNAKGYTSIYHILWRIILIVLFEEYKIIKLNKIIYGILDGIKMEIKE